ncbi:MAG: hypothetical protein AAF196_14535 [Planctomycetota bacterium]
MRLPNLVDVLLLLGIVALGVALAWPWVQGHRGARIEDRASDIAHVLLQEAFQRTPIDLSDRDLHRELEEALRAGCASLGHPQSKLPTRIEGAEEPTFETEHYLYRLTRLPEDFQAAPIQDDLPSRQPLEVYAWPKSLFPPGRTIFFYPEDDAPAFTRNLARRRYGLDRLPLPGSGRQINPPDSRGGYRSQDDERWIPMRP